MWKYQFIFFSFSSLLLFTCYVILECGDWMTVGASRKARAKKKQKIDISESFQAGRQVDE
jgi:hypothetical protein